MENEKIFKLIQTLYFKSPINLIKRLYYIRIIKYNYIFFILIYISYNHYELKIW